jgi:hypothetical protein
MMTMMMPMSVMLLLTAAEGLLGKLQPLLHPLQQRTTVHGATGPAVTAPRDWDRICI